LTDTDVLLKLLESIRALIIPFIRDADQAAPDRAIGNREVSSRNVLVDLHTPDALLESLKFSLPTGEGLGKDGLLDVAQKVLQHSVNTWDQGFLDKLYASNNAVG
jgi:glutamate decarboxylase